MKFKYIKLKEPFISYSLIKQCFFRNKESEIVMTWSRASCINNFMLHKIINVHNGIHFAPISITNSFLYDNSYNYIKNPHKLGEFSVTKHLHIRKKNERKIRR